MNCQQASSWMWESEQLGASPPVELAIHLLECPECASEDRARRALSAALAGVRGETEEAPPEAVEERAREASRTAVVAQESGAFEILPEELLAELAHGHVDELPAEVDDPLTQAIIDEVAESISEDYGAAFASYTTDSLLAITEEQAAQGWRGRPASEPMPDPPEAPEDGSPQADKPQDERGPSTRTAQAWRPPRARRSWMMTATLLLCTAAALGFMAGRWTALGPPGTSGSASANARLIASQTGLMVRTAQRIHTVGLSPEALNTLAEGHTYLLMGPIGGPYKVIGVVGWEGIQSVTLPEEESSELVVALGPAGGWSRGAQLALWELQLPSVEILGRRALPKAH